MWWQEYVLDGQAMYGGEYEDMYAALSAYARGTRCPVLTWCMVRPGTAQRRSLTTLTAMTSVGSPPIVLHLRYATSSTGVGCVGCAASHTVCGVRYTA